MSKQLIKKWEGCRLSAYKCAAGVWTIGYGHTKSVKAGDKWTQQQADDALDTEVNALRETLFKLAPALRDEPAHRVDACVSLAYNIGATAFANSSVCRFIKAKRYQDAADAFLLWNKARVNGKLKVVDGLTNRRHDERRLFMGSL
jgi:lysozyme